MNESAGCTHLPAQRHLVSLWEYDLLSSMTSGEATCRACTIKAYLPQSTLSAPVPYPPDSKPYEGH